MYVVDTGECEMYVIAADEFEAAEKVTALGEPIEYVEHYLDTDDPNESPYPKEVVL